MQTMKIKAIRPATISSDSGTTKVYDITVEDTHRYFADGILVGNSKRMAMLDVNALLSHGATEVIRDASAIRGQKNEDYWLQFMSGHKPRDPKVPMVYRKFVDELKASGINVVQNGSQTNIMAMTDSDVDELSGDREVINGETASWGEGLKPIKGGLFDEKLTGGHHGQKWAHIKLPEPMPNPVMEEPIRHILGLTKKQMYGVIDGTEEIPGGLGKGSKALYKALDNINLDRELVRARVHIEQGNKGQRDKAIRKLGYLKSAKRLGMHPRDWMMTKVPVLPPQFRPINMIENKEIPLVADPNFLYKDLLDANDNLKEMSKAIGEDNAGDERLAVYNAFKAVTGLGDPITEKSKEKNIRGILKTVFGSSPKFGCFDDQTEILTRRGWLLFADLLANDEVMTLDPATNACVWQAINEIHRYPYRGELFSFSTPRGLDVVVTPNHRNWVRPRLKSRTQDDMEHGWLFESAYRTASSRGRRWFRTAASEWDGHFDRPDFLPANTDPVDFAEFVGWWAAEGWLADRKKTSVQMCQAVKQEAYCQEIDRLYGSLNLGKVGTGTYDKNVPSGGVCVARQWWLNSAELSEWLSSNVGELARCKALSSEVKDWPVELLEAFMRGYLRGDGGKRHTPRNGGGVTHRNRTDVGWEHGNASTTSNQLADDLVEIACKLGLTARKRVSREETIQTDGSVYRTLYRVNLDTSRFVVVEDSIESVLNYEGEVHCVSVDNGIVYVRRNGKPVFSGNSVQRKLISSTVDNVGRAVITPNPDMDMDQVGLPEDKAFEVYQRFVARRLKRRGMPLSQALREVKDRSPLARQMLIEEMEHRPVIINRAPVLHRFGIMAFYPQLTKGDTMQVSPLIVKGFGADFDGDAMNYHVPTSDEARKEAIERMLPSRQLLSPSDFKSPVHVPSQEYVLGLYHATSNKSRRPTRTFATKKDVFNAWARGEISVNDQIKVMDS